MVKHSVLILLVVVFLTATYAQAPACQVEGVAMDWNYAVIPNLQIELVGPKTYKTISANDGTFKFPEVVEGDYEIKLGAHYSREYWKPVYKMRKLKLEPSKGQRRQHVDLVLKPVSMVIE